jgi:hypothetical protein
LKVGKTQEGRLNCVGFFFLFFKELNKDIVSIASDRVKHNKEREIETKHTKKLY